MKRFSCHFPGCSSSYRRKEHLQRHLVQHTGTQRSPCPFCDRVFTRHDTMRRHTRQDHEAEAEPKRLCDVRAEQACKSCRMSTSRCNGRKPCQRCLHKGLRCSSSSSDEVVDRRTHSSTVRRRRSNAGAAANGRPSQLPPSASDNTRSVHRNIELYFRHFHPQWPFLHPSTFSVQDEPSLLLYSVVAVGLWAEGTACSQAKALAIHDKIGDSIIQQKSQWDGTIRYNKQKDGHTASAWPIATYQGILLYLILALLRSRQRSAAEFDLRLHLSPSDHGILVALVRTCRRHNLFFYPTMLGRYHGIDSTACIWVGVEEIKRFGIALYKVCKLYSSNIDKTGSFESDLLTLSDLQFPMPDSNELWNAESDEVLSRRLAEVDSNATVDGRLEENWISKTLLFGGSLEFG